MNAPRRPIDPTKRSRDQRAALELLRSRGELATSEVAAALSWPDYHASRVLHSLHPRRVERSRLVDDVDPSTTWTVWRARP